MAGVTADKKLVFIVSGGRTGTAFFGERLSEVVNDCVSVHDPDQFVSLNQRVYRQIRQFGWWHIVFGKLLGRTGLRAVGTRYLSGRLSEGECRDLMAKFRRSFHQSFSQSLIIESNSQWWYVVDQIPVVWPEAKIISVIRDPRTWIRSWLNKGGRYVKHDRVSLVPPGRLTPRKLGDDKWAARWKGLDPFGKLAWEWNAVYGKLDHFVSRCGNGRMYRFEDLFSGDGSTMENLVRFAASHEGVDFSVASLDGFSDDVRNASTGSATDWPSWVPERARLLDEICGSLMQRYGYGHEPEWADLVSR